MTYVLSFEMELLRVSIGTQCASTQKEKTDESGQNLIHVQGPSYIIILPTLLTFHKKI